MTGPARPRRRPQGEAPTEDEQPNALARLAALLPAFNDAVSEALAESKARTDGAAFIYTALNAAAERVAEQDRRIAELEIEVAEWREMADAATQPDAAPVVLPIARQQAKAALTVDRPQREMMALAVVRLPGDDVKAEVRITERARRSFDRHFTEDEQRGVLSTLRRVMLNPEQCVFTNLGAHARIGKHQLYSVWVSRAVRLIVRRETGGYELHDIARRNDRTYFRNEA